MGKKSYAVVIGATVGNEHVWMIHFSEFYGPYTEVQAESAAKKLNAHFKKEQGDDAEGQEASVLSLTMLMPVDLVWKYTGKRPK